MINKISAGTVRKLASLGRAMQAISAQLRNHYDTATDAAQRGALHRFATVTDECGRNIADDIARHASSVLAG